MRGRKIAWYLGHDYGVDPAVLAESLVPDVSPLFSSLATTSLTYLLTGVVGSWSIWCVGCKMATKYEMPEITKGFQRLWIFV
jgi:hypothetical protein